MTARKLSACWLAAIILALPLPLLASPWQQQFGGDLRNYSLLLKSVEGIGTPDNIDGLDLIDTRFKANWQRQPLQIEVHLLHEALLRSAGSIPSFSGFALNGVDRGFRIDTLETLSYDDANFVTRLTPDRALIRISGRAVAVTVGRQPISFGKTFFWNPLDWVTPFPAFTVDRAYKSGVDAVRLQWFPSRMGEVCALYAAGETLAWDRSAAILQLQTALPGALENIDVELLAGKVREDIRGGIGFAATPPWLGGGALRGEGTWWEPLRDPTPPVPAAEPGGFLQASVGYDRTFAADSRLLVEYHYNGAGTTDATLIPQLAATARYREGELTSFARHSLALQGSWQPWPFLEPSATAIINVSDPSAQVGAALGYDAAENVQLDVGAMFALGARPANINSLPPSEFGLYPHLFYLQTTFTF